MDEPASLFDETEISGTNYGRVTDAIRDRIVRGTYPPGSRLKVNDLCEQFRISSNPVREALQQLQGEGLVVILPNKGATVRLIDGKLIRHIYEIGAVLDGYLAARCAEIATPAQVQRLRDIEKLLEDAVAAGEGLGRADRNRDFHTCFGEISGNTEAVSIRRRHHNLIRTIRLRYGFSATRMDGIIAEHRAIIEAIASGDVAAAEQAARVHSQNSLDDMLKRYQGFTSVEEDVSQDD